MLRDTERRRAIDLIRRLRAARDTPTENLSTARHERLVARIAAIGTEINEIAEAAWLREFGLEQFTVLSVRPALRTWDVSFMVDTISLSQWCGIGPLHWDFRGSKLRKDGLVGALSAHVMFREAAVARRHLSGQWEALRIAMEKAA